MPNIMHGLVSVITPCFNTAAYLPRLLTSLLTQTYPNIEIVVVDDGSEDNIQEVVGAFSMEFKKRGYALHYLRQPNSGQSVAVQNALGVVKGEYLVWPDSDDYYASAYAIQKMVERFESLPDEFAMVRTHEYVVDDSIEHKILRLNGLNTKILEPQSLFVDCLLQLNNFYYCPGAYMVKVDALLSSTHLPIFTSKDAGQNWQLMLPVLYHYRCSTIQEPLYHVVDRTSSHSRSKKDYGRQRDRIITYRDTILGTLNRIKNMPHEQYKAYTRMVEEKYARTLLMIAAGNGQRTDADYYYRWLRSNSKLTIGLTIRYVLCKTGLYGAMQNVVDRMRGHKSLE